MKDQILFKTGDGKQQILRVPEFIVFKKGFDRWKNRAIKGTRMQLNYLDIIINIVSQASRITSAMLLQQTRANAD